MALCYAVHLGATWGTWQSAGSQKPAEGSEAASMSDNADEEEKEEDEDSDHRLLLLGGGRVRCSGFRPLFLFEEANGSRTCGCTEPSVEWLDLHPSRVLGLGLGFG
jgi:hypothetical protein